METSERNVILNFHENWKQLCKNTAKTWLFIVYFIVFGGLIVKYSLLGDWLWTTIVTLMLLLSARIHYYSRRRRYVDFLENYRRLLFAIQEDPTNKEYHKILWEYEKFIGIAHDMGVHQIIPKLRRLPGSKFYHGENKTGYLRTYEFEDTLEDLAKRYQKTVNMITDRLVTAVIN